MSPQSESFTLNAPPQPSAQSHPPSDYPLLFIHFTQMLPPALSLKHFPSFTSFAPNHPSFHPSP